MREEKLATIRLATPADIPALRQLCIETFTDTYAMYNTPENMQLYISTYFNLLRLLDEITSTTAWYYLAFADGVLAGYMKMRMEENPPELAGIKHIEIERIYVMPQLKGLKIGKQLVRHAQIVAKHKQCQVLWLGVWERNEKARGFYVKQGFTIFGEHTFMLGTDEQKDWLMKKEIADL